MALRNPGAPTATRTPKPLTSWSFSRHHQYQECPLKFKLKFLDKLPEPESPALARGNLVHETIDKYISGAVTTLGDTVASTTAKKDIALFRKEYAKAQKAGTLGEEVVTNTTWGFSKDWKVVPWDDWNNCRLRVKVDYSHFNRKLGSIRIVDFKTGKFRKEKNDEYLDQLFLYAAAALVRFPTATKVVPELLYVDGGEVFEPDEDYTRDGLEQYTKEWEKRTQMMFLDRTYAPRPGDYCRYCHFSASKTGRCKY